MDAYQELILIRQAVLEVAALPVNELQLVLDYVAHLKDQREVPTAQRPLVAELRAAARQHATVLKTVPRAVVASQLGNTIERIRGQAIAQETALDGDWHDD
jgi:hypothetical protein